MNQGLLKISCPTHANLLMRTLLWECYLLVSHTATAEAYEWS